MGNYTRDEILQMAEDEDVEFIRLQFTDMFGTLKNIAITARELPRALNNEYLVDGSFLAGIASKQEPDMYLYPDLGTFTILPWRPQQGKVARLLCDIHKPDGTVNQKSPRTILRQITKKAKAKGYTCFVDPECEFFLFHTDDNGMPTTLSHEKAGYLDMSPVDLGENARRDMVLSLEEMGLQVVSSHHETAPAQHEIDFKQDEAFRMADCIMTFKMAVRTIAKRHGLHATFMPKPRAQVNGSGMHVRFSLYKKGKNVFSDEKDPSALSQEAYYFAGGLLAHSREMALITNPLVNSYKRLVPGYEAPTELAWTKDGQSSLIRLPVGRGLRTGIELRSPDAAANPYLVFAVCLEAGLDGIKKKIDPEKACGAPCAGAEDVKESPQNLPENLKEAIEAFEGSLWIREVLGEDFCREYAEAKKQEWLRYTRQVTPWEVEEYLYRI